MSVELTVVYCGMALLSVGVLVGPGLCRWWFDYDRRPAFLHRSDCHCWNCNDYVGSTDD